LGHGRSVVGTQTA